MNQLSKTSTLGQLGYFIALLTFLTTLVHYQLVAGGHMYITQDFVASPEQYHGREKVFLAPYAGPDPEGFYILYNQQKLLVKYPFPHEPPRWGEILVDGVLDRKGFIIGRDVHNMDYNYLIYAVSALAGIFVIAVFFREWRLTRRGFVHA